MIENEVVLTVMGPAKALELFVGKVGAGELWDFGPVDVEGDGLPIDKAELVRMTDVMAVWRLALVNDWWTPLRRISRMYPDLCFLVEGVSEDEHMVMLVQYGDDLLFEQVDEPEWSGPFVHRRRMRRWE